LKSWRSAWKTEQDTVEREGEKERGRIQPGLEEERERERERERDGALGRLAHEAEAQMNGTSVLIQEAREACLPSIT
jgi:hypothetical protein